MIDHMGIGVSDFEKSKNFYKAALEPLGYKLTTEMSPEHPETEGEWVAGFGTGPNPKRDADFWIYGRDAVTPALHVGFRAKSEKEVNEFYQAALAAGGRDNGAPALRPQYFGQYYAAFVLDPDGHNIEAVYHGERII